MDFIESLIAADQSLFLSLTSQGNPSLDALFQTVTQPWISYLILLALLVHAFLRMSYSCDSLGGSGISPPAEKPGDATQTLLCHGRPVRASCDILWWSIRFCVQPCSYLVCCLGRYAGE
jgi:hypothetical protein